MDPSSDYLRGIKIKGQVIPIISQTDNVDTPDRQKGSISASIDFIVLPCRLVAAIQIIIIIIQHLLSIIATQKSFVD